MGKLDSNAIKKMQSWGIFILVIANILAFMVLSNFIHTRIDMTQGNFFSISKPTVQLLEKLDNTMVIEYYYNDKCKEHPRMAKIVQYIEDILSDYERSGKGYLNVLVKELNYDKDAAEIDDIERMGIQPIYLSERNEGESKSAVGYSGIVIKYKNNQKVIPAVYADIGFEYSLDKEIKKLVDNQGTGIGVIFGIPNLQFEKDFGYLKQVVEEEHQAIQVIAKGQNIPDDIGQLIIIGGSALSDYDIFKIDQFLMNGGQAFVSMNGVNVMINQQYGIYGMANESKLFDLLSYYGITVNKDLVGDNDSFNKVAQRNMYHRYPIWPLIKSDNMAADHQIMGELKSLNMFWPSSVDVDEKIEDDTEILFSTTENSWASTGDYRLDFQTYRYPIQTGERAFNIAVAFDGKLTSFYEGQDVPENADGEDTFTRTRKNSGKSKLVVVGNESFLENNFTSQQELYFVMSSLDWLGSDNLLTEIRTKGKFAQPLEKPKNESQFTTRKRVIIAISTYVVPVLFILLAIILNILRFVRNKDISLVYKKQ